MALTLAFIGRVACLLGLCVSLYAAVVVALGISNERPSTAVLAKRFALFLFVTALVAFGAMELGLVRHEFRLEYVAHNNSRSTPFLYTVAGLWAALEGSILLWALVLTGYLLAVVRVYRERLSDPVVSWAFVVICVVAAFFFFLLSGPANPFRLLPSGAVPTDGQGPNPLLQNHPLMAVHPPLLYLGYVGFTVPFGFAVGALITGRVDEGWIAATRRFTLIAWGFLTLGIVLGAWWSYEVLGWGGYWAWDPVENASFIPWLTATAFIHSIMVQERRSMLRVWNISLVAATFALTILGTFLTRSGVIESVHAFSDSAIGPLLVGFFALIVIVTVGLIGYRGDRLRAPGEIDSPLSREAAFLFNNLLFAVFAFVVLLGTVYPLLVEAFGGDQLSVGRPYFDRMSIPLASTLLFLMAIAPVLSWRSADLSVLWSRLRFPALFAVSVMSVAALVGARGLAPVLTFGLGALAGGVVIRQLFLATRRNGWRGLMGRTNGGMVVHLGVVFVAIGIAASGSYRHATDLTLTPDTAVEFGGHSFVLGVVTSVEHGNRKTTSVQVRVDDDFTLAPALHTYAFASQPVGTPSVKTGLLRDVYLSLRSLPTKTDPSAVVAVVIHPLVVWIWIGGLVMALGTALALVPGKRRNPLRPVSAPFEDALAEVGVGSETNWRPVL